MFATVLGPDVSLMVGMPATVWGLCCLRWWAKPLALFANCLVVFLLATTLNGAVSYVNNTGKLRRGGDYHHHYENFNLHREHRCFVSHTGDCRPYIFQDLSDKSFNLGLVFCLEQFGPMDEHFLGAYPTIEEAHQLIETSGSVVRHRDLSRCRFGFPDNVKFSFFEHSKTYGRHDKPPLEKIDKDSIVRFCSDGKQTIIIAVDQYAVLFDSQTGRPYARYHFSPDYLASSS